MNLKTFKDTLQGQTSPPELSPTLTALWLAAKGEWSAAHELAQEQDNPAGAWVHAYLHRTEGDTANAAYWYKRAGQQVAQASLETEWEDIVERLLRESTEQR